MPHLTDPVILAAFHATLSNWNVTDYVTEKDTAMEWRAKEMPHVPLKAVAKRMYEHLQAGGTIDQTPETRRSGTTARSITTFASSLTAGAFTSRPSWWMTTLPIRPSTL